MSFSILVFTTRVEIIIRSSRGHLWESTRSHWASYLIFVTGTTGAARVKISVRCKFFQIERQKLHI